MATTNNVQGDEPLRSTTLERQVQTLMAAVDCLTKQNHDLEEQLRQRDAGHDVQEENKCDSSEQGGPERPEGSNEPSRPERQNLSMPSLMNTALPPIFEFNQHFQGTKRPVHLTLHWGAQVQEIYSMPNEHKAVGGRDAEILHNSLQQRSTLD